MKNNFLKISVAIIIAIALIFVVTLAIISFSVSINDVLLFRQESIGFTLLLILAIAFVALSVFVLINLFSGYVNTKTIPLDSDVFSAVSTNDKVIKRLIRRCVKALPHAKLVKAKITEDDKPGYKLAMHVRLKDCKVINETQKLKFLLEDSFKKELDFCFNSITIKVSSLRNDFEPDIKKAEQYVANKQAEENCKSNCKIASPSPKEEQVLKETLNTNAINAITRIDSPSQDYSKQMN